jgi:hypothetical protein
VLSEGTQRGPVQVVKVSVRDQNQVNGREISKLDSRLAQPLQDKQPAGKIGVDHDILPANLEEKAGMTDERYTQLSVADQFGFVRFSGARADGRVTDQPPEGTGAFAKSRVLETSL